MKDFAGIYTPLITPFVENRVNEEALRKQIQLQEKAGVAGLVILGTTGEAHSLSEEEKLRILEIAKECSLPIISGEQREGVDAWMVTPPSYIRPTQEGIYQYYCQIAAKSDIPIIVYNIPSRCGINIEPQTLERLAKIDTIVALKECNSAQARLGPLTLLCGDDVSLLSMMALGGKGAIASTANFVPKKMVQLIDLCLGNDFNTARSLYYELLPLFEAGGWESNPIPCKMMMDLLGLEAGVPRFPLLECTKEDELRRLLWKLGYLADRDGSPKPTANC